MDWRFGPLPPDEEMPKWVVQNLVENEGTGAESPRMWRKWMANNASFSLWRTKRRAC